MNTPVLLQCLVDQSWSACVSTFVNKPGFTTIYLHFCFGEVFTQVKKNPHFPSLNDLTVYYQAHLSLLLPLL